MSKIELKNNWTIKNIFDYFTQLITQELLQTRRMVRIMVTDHGNCLIIEQLCGIYLTEVSILLFCKAISNKNKTY